MGTTLGLSRWKNTIFRIVTHVPTKLFKLNMQRTSLMGSREITISNLRKACRTQCSDIKGRHITSFIREASYLCTYLKHHTCVIPEASYERTYLVHYTYVHTWSIIRIYIPGASSNDMLRCQRQDWHVSGWLPLVDLSPWNKLSI